MGLIRLGTHKRTRHVTAKLNNLQLLPGTIVISMVVHITQKRRGYNDKPGIIVVLNQAPDTNFLTMRRLSLLPICSRIRFPSRYAPAWEGYTSSNHY